MDKNRTNTKNKQDEKTHNNLDPLNIPAGDETQHKKAFPKNPATGESHKGMSTERKGDDTSIGHKAMSQAEQKTLSAIQRRRLVQNLEWWQTILRKRIDLHRANFLHPDILRIIRIVDNFVTEYYEMGYDHWPEDDQT